MVPRVSGLTRRPVRPKVMYSLSFIAGTILPLTTELECPATENQIQPRIYSTRTRNLFLYYRWTRVDRCDTWRNLFYFWNFISTVICTGTGLPPLFAGENFHFFTVATALDSNAGFDARSTCTNSTLPLVLMPTSMSTIPFGSV